MGTVVSGRGVNKRFLEILILIFEIDSFRFTMQIHNYQHETVHDMVYLSNHFLARHEHFQLKQNNVQSLDRQLVFRILEIILYPYINIEEKNNQLFLRNTDYTDILYQN